MEQLQDVILPGIERAVKTNSSCAIGMYFRISTNGRLIHNVTNPTNFDGNRPIDEYFSDRAFICDSYCIKHPYFKAYPIGYYFNDASA